jgi:hypothetical protein
MSAKNQTRKLPLTGAKAQSALDPLATGMPAQDSILDDKTTFRPKAGGPTYRILKTTEVDSYETTAAATGLRKAMHGIKTPALAAMLAAAKKPPSTGDQFAGSARMAAKLSIPTAPTKTFSDVAALVASLPSVASMVALNIPTGPTSGRVQQEQRNIHVTGFLFAASREADNDFHLIVGCDPKAAQETYMTMEVSGLPPSNSPAFGPINAARNSYKQFFGTNLPGAGYNFYQPPIPVQVDGALFFDATHSKGQAPGPPSLKSRMPTIFEVHPVTNIKLGP